MSCGLPSAHAEEQVTLWGSHPSSAAGVRAVNSQRQSFSICGPWLIFQPRQRPLYRGLSLLSADLLPLVPARNHGLLWVHRLHSKTPELTHWQSTTQPRKRKAEVWRETKVLPPLCKGQQLSPMDCPDGHRGDQARDGLLCNQGLARREDQKFADRQAKTECWWGRWIQTPVKKRQEGQAV